MNKFFNADEMRTGVEAVIKEFESLATAYDKNPTFRNKMDEQVRAGNLEGVRSLCREGGLSEPQHLTLSPPLPARTVGHASGGGHPTPEYTKCWGKGKWWGGCITIKVTITSD